MQAKQKQIPYNEHCKTSTLARKGRKLFLIFKSNIEEIQTIDNKIFNMSNLVLDYVPHSIFEPMNHTIESLNKDVEAYHLHRFSELFTISSKLANY